MSQLPPTISGATTAVTAFVGGAEQGPIDVAVAIDSAQAFTSTFGSGVTPLSVAVSQFFQNGGALTLIVRASGTAVPLDDDVSAPGLEGGGRGLWALNASPEFNLLCVPPYTFGPDGDISARTRRSAVELCRRHRAFFLADPPSSWTSAAAVLTGAEGLGSATWGLPRDSFAAVYMPRIVVPHPTNKADLVCAPSGAIAGVIARVDRTRGVWKAPAGQEAGLIGVTGLTIQLDAPDLDELNRAAVNILRVVPNGQRVIWGARTLAGDDASASEWKYVPVRRLALFIETSIDERTQWAADEPNGEPLWAKLRLEVSALLQDLFRAGAFAGRTSREAYFVKCDRQTTTQADIDAGRVHIVVGFAALKPAEFIVLEFVTKAGPADDDD